MSTTRLTVVIAQSALDTFRHLGKKRQLLFHKATRSLAQNPFQGTAAHTAVGRSLRTLRLDTNLRIVFQIDEKLGKLLILAIVGRGGIR